jgi:uncharacterized protein YutE (UPF0331/DUF86 family)
VTREIILQKIESIERCLKRIQDKTPGSVAELKKDLDTQDIIAINLERTIQLSVDMAMIILSEENVETPATMGDAFESLSKIGIISPELCERMQKAVGFRNVAVHAYKEIEWPIVWNIITGHLDEFRSLCSSAYQWK